MKVFAPVEIMQKAIPFSKRGNILHWLVYTDEDSCVLYSGTALEASPFCFLLLLGVNE